MSNHPLIFILKKNLPRYLTGSVLTAIIGMLMNKYYTQVFTPAEYGVLAMYMSFCLYLQNILTFTVDSAWQRCYFDYKDTKRSLFFGTILTFSLGTISMWLIILFVFSQQINSYLGDRIDLYYITIFIAIVAIYVKFVNLISYNENLSGLVLKQNLIQAMFNHGISAILIMILGLGIMGRQVGQFFGYLGNAFFYTKELVKKDMLNVKWAIDSDVVKSIKPFAVSSFSTIIITSTIGYMDKFILMQYHGATNVGVYSLGMLIGQGMNLVIEAVSISVFPTIISLLQENYQENIKKLKRFDQVWCGILIVVAIGVYLLREYLILIFANVSYLAASPVISLIVLGYVCGGCYKNVSNVLAYHNKVWFYPIIAGISAILSIGLNLWLIPKYSELGAAYAFFLGAYVYSLMVHIMGTPYYWKMIKVLFFYGIIFVLGTLLFVTSL